MKNRMMWVMAGVVTAAGGAFLLSTTAHSQSGLGKGTVDLQAVNPGYSQSGNANISGTMRAGQFIGNGAGLTGVVATISLPFSGSGSTPVSGGVFTVNQSGAGHALLGQIGGAAVPGTAAAVSGTATSNRGVQGVSFSSVGVYGTSNTSTGVFGASSNGIGVIGSTAGTYGVHGFSSSFNGSGVRAESSGGNGYGLYATGYRAVYADSDYRAITAYSNASGATGLYVDLDATSGISSGVEVYNASSSGIGVDVSMNSATGTPYAVRGQISSTGGSALYGTSLATTGTTTGAYGYAQSSSGRGVIGHVSSSTGTTYGVRGVVFSPNGFGIYSAGDTGASGTKSFVIDHPQDPLNKYLRHYCSEGPEPLNVYRGRVNTDKNGYATVQLPSYFGSINTDFTYQLTVIDNSDDFVLAKVTEEIEGDTFRVRTNKPFVTVCWQVQAQRNDPYVRQRGFKVEYEKSPEEKGKLQHPELYGMPAEMGMDKPVIDRQVLRNSKRKK